MFFSLSLHRDLLRLCGRVTIVRKSYVFTFIINYNENILFSIRLFLYGNSCKCATTCDIQWQLFIQFSCRRPIDRYETYDCHKIKEDQYG